MAARTVTGIQMAYKLPQRLDAGPRRHGERFATARGAMVRCFLAGKYRAATALAVVAIAALHGSTSTGPQTVSHDRFNYVESISDAWNRHIPQDLLKIRYAHAPVFIAVTSVMSSQTRSGSTYVRGELQADYPADVVMRICMSSMNSHANESGFRGNTNPGD